MAYLTLNNINIPLTSCRDSSTRFGEPIAHVYSGKPVKTQRKQLRTWVCTSAPLIASEAQSLRALIDGEGHHWSFNADLYSDMGLHADVGHTFTANSYNGTLGYPTGYTSTYLYTGATGGSFSTGWSTYSASYWFHNTSTWVHATHTSAGTKYVNGTVSTGDFPTTLAGGVVTLAAGWYLDDLVILNTTVAQSHAASFAFLGRAFSALPKLYMTGDIGTYDVVGRVDSCETNNAASASGRVMYTLEFTLVEAT
jgi:hypothetical protein